MSTFAGQQQTGIVEQFVLGGLAAMTASALTHPIDLIKVRMQLYGELSGVKSIGPIRTFINVCSNEGLKGLYKGLSASLLRQATYSSTRLGVYGPIKEILTPARLKGPLPLWRKVVAGMTAGGLGAAVGSPADLVMVRMQADGRLPPEKRRNYKNVFNGLYRIVKEEGVFTLWRGSQPTVIRAMLVTAGQLSTYDQMKQTLLATRWFKDNFVTHFICSFVAGFVATVLTSPVDVAKTRIMNQKPKPDGSLEYRGLFECLYKTTRTEGFFGLYKGFTPNFLRLAPHTILMLMIYEQLINLWMLIPGRL